MKLRTGHHGHKSIPGAKFEASSSLGFGDMTSQNFPRKKGTSNQIRLNFKKMSFYVQDRSSRPKIDPPCQFQQFPSRGNFFIL